MRTIGLIGGMSWESTTEYYRILNRLAAEALGGLHSAKVLLHSVDFGEVELLLRAGDWDAIAHRLSAAGRGLAEQGADCVLICTNTMHLVADRVQAAAGVPLIHIAEAAADAAQARGLTTLGILGTAPTMEMGLYEPVLKERGIAAVIPDAGDRAEIHRVIFEELCLGRIEDASREFHKAVVRRLADKGADGVALACTEIPLLLGPEDSPLPLLDTTFLHAKAAMDFALA